MKRDVKRNAGDEMKSPERITIALDEETAGLFKKMKEDLGMSQSELMRESLKFFGKHKMLSLSSPRTKRSTPMPRCSPQASM